MDKRDVTTSQLWVEHFAGLASGNLTASPASAEPSKPLSADQSLEFDIPHKYGRDDPSLPLQLAWASVLAIYTGSNDVVFGWSFRQGAAVPRRIRVPSASTVDAALCRLRQDQPIVDAMEKQPLPTSDQAAEDECLRRALCFESILVIDGVDGGPNVPPSVLLSIACARKPARLTVRAKWDGNRLEGLTARMMLGQLDHAMQLICHGAARSVAELSTISPKAQDYLKQSNENPLPSVRSDCVHRLFQAHAESRPDALAVQAWDGTLTYGELDSLSARVSQELVNTGIGPNRFVALLFPKSTTMAVALMAVLKAGGAFLFLDHSQPDHRLRLICTESQTAAILVSPDLHTRAMRLGPFTIPLTVDKGTRDGQGVGETLTPIPTPVVQPHDALYAVFTSGSSGKPKGVVVTQEAYGAAAQRYGPQIGVDAASRVFQMAGHAFALSVMDYLTAFIRGATVCVPREDELQGDPTRAIALFEATWAQMTPSLARTLNPELLPRLRTLLLAGEAMTRSDIRRWTPHLTLKSEYGQSELALTVFVTDKCSVNDHPNEIQTPPLARAWVVDPTDHERLMPVGAVGEMVVETDLAAKGYLDAPTTANTFIQAPSWINQIRPGLKHASFIKTGDLVRQVSPNRFVLAGRKGTQVKLRGQRIELAEVECYLHPHFPGHQAVVVELITPQDAEADAAMLMAFVVTQSSAWPCQDAFHTAWLHDPSRQFLQTVDKAKSELRRQLPAFMLPSIILPARAVPRTPTSKIDRRRLRALAGQLSQADLHPYRIGPHRHRPGVKPSPNYRIVQELCAHVLKTSPDSLVSNGSFLDAGGNSLTAIRLLASARARGWSLDIKDVFEASLDELSNTMKPLPGAGAGARNPPDVQDPFAGYRGKVLGLLPDTVSPSDVVDAFPLREVQKSYIPQYHRMYSLFQMRRRRHDGSLELLRQACEYLVQTHSMFRSIFLDCGGEMTQVILRQIPVLFEVHPAGEAGTLATAESLCREDMGQPVVIADIVTKFILVQASSITEPDVFALRLSHAQYDGVCFPIFIRDLWAAYEGQSLTVTADYGNYVRQCYRGCTESALSFWESVVKASAVVRWNDALADVCVPGEAGCDHYYGRDIAMPHLPRGITLGTLVKAAWAVVLWQETATSDILFGQLANTRATEGMQDVIGPCQAILPVRVRCDSGWTGRDVLRAIQQQYIDSICFDAVEWPDILKRCFPSMPADTFLDWIVLHQTTRLPEEWNSDSLHCKYLNMIHPAGSEPATWLITRPSEDETRLEVGLAMATDTLISGSKAQRLLNRTCNLLNDLTRRPDVLLNELTLEDLEVRL